MLQSLARTGAAGLLTVENALSAGHQVTAFARNPSKLTIEHANLTVIEGELTDLDKIDESLTGADAVITLLGPLNMDKGLPISKGNQIYHLEHAKERR